MYMASASTSSLTTAMSSCSQVYVHGISLHVLSDYSDELLLSGIHGISLHVLCDYSDELLLSGIHGISLHVLSHTFLNKKPEE
jgi:hypothetical protein